MIGLGRASEAHDVTSRHQRVRRVSAGLLVLGLCAGAAVWVASPSHHRRPRDSPSPLPSAVADPGSLPMILSPQNEQTSFSVFRTPPEGLPVSVRRGLRPNYGVNWLLAQRLPVKVGARVWAIPGNGYICLLSLQNQSHSVAGTNCATNQEALSHGLATTFLSTNTSPAHSTRVIFGMAPDRTREVIASTNGRTVRIPVIDGLFVRNDRATDPPDELTLVKGAR